MKTIVTLAVGALTLIAFGTASATTKTYVQAGIGDTLAIVDCGPPHTDGTPDGFGGVCFGVGQVAVNGLGQGAVAIADATGNPTSGFACQDNNADNGCGDPAIGELSEPFCVGTVLGDGDNWSALLDTLVFIDGPVFGNPAISPCGALSAGTTGSVSA